MRLRLLVSALLVATLLAPTASAQTGDNSAAFGVTFSANETDARAIPAVHSLGYLHGAGAGWARVNVAWQIVQPVQAGPFDFSAYDTLIDAAEAEGMQVLVVLAYSTTWGTTAPRSATNRTHYPPRLDPWLTYVRATVSHFRDRVDSYEVWNEPDLTFFWQGTPAQYAQLLSASHDAIKALDPTAVVLNGGLAMNDPTDAFFVAVLADPTSPVAARFEVANFHHYGSGQLFRARWTRLQADLAAAGIVGRRTWVTETGASSDPTKVGDPQYQGLSGQAKWLTDALPYERSLGAERIFVFTPWDDPLGGFQYASHGLLDSTLVPKPARDAFAAVIAGG